MDNIVKALEELIKTVQTLRSPGGCNWDREQTLQSLRPYMLEEAYEVADAVDNNDMGELRKELGDLLLHIIMSADICSEQKFFNLADVAEQITEKLKRRHPHVFDKNCELTPAQVEKQWEAIKAVEKKNQKKRFFDSIPAAMPSLQKAWRIQQRANEMGYSRKTRRESAEEISSILKREDINEDAIGRILFEISSIAGLSGIEPENALSHRNNDFIERFNSLEELLHADGCSLSDVNETQLKKCIEVAFKGWD